MGIVISYSKMDNGTLNVFLEPFNKPLMDLEEPEGSRTF